MKRIKLTKTAVDELPTPEGTARVTYWDSELRGFCVRVSQKYKIYYAVKRVKGKPQWVKIGAHGLMTADQARSEALNNLSDLNKGIDVNKQKAKDREKGTTLSEVLDAYFEAKPDLRPNTVSTYRSLMENHLKDWLNKALEEITKDMVSKRHLKLAEKIGRAQANNVMRTFRLLYNYAYALSDGDMPENPVQRLSHTKQWFRIDRRRTMLREYEIKPWITTVRALENPVISDYLQFVLFTGLREREALQLSWGDVCFEDRTFTIRKESAKNKRECVLPMSDFVFGLLQRRKDLRENDFVFPGTGKTGHLVEVHRQLKLIEEMTATRKASGDIETPGIRVCLHDLRRTFASIAESETSYMAVKTLLNHSISGDVTQGYIQVPMSDLRKAVEKISQRLLRAIKADEPKGGKVIPFSRHGGLS